MAVVLQIEAAGCPSFVSCSRALPVTSVDGDSHPMSQASPSSLRCAESAIADTLFISSSSVLFPRLWSMATACADPTHAPTHGPLPSDLSRHHVCSPRLILHRGHQAALHSVTRIDLERGGTRHPPLLARSDPLLWPALLPRPGSRAALASVWGEHGRVGEVFEGDGTAAYSEMVEWRAGEGGKEREGEGGRGAGLGRLPQLRCRASLFKFLTFEDDPSR